MAIELNIKVTTNAGESVADVRKQLAELLGFTAGSYNITMTTTSVPSDVGEQLTNAIRGEVAVIAKEEEAEKQLELPLSQAYPPNVPATPPPPPPANEQVEAPKRRGRPPKDSKQADVQSTPAPSVPQLTGDVVTNVPPAGLTRVEEPPVQPAAPATPAAQLPPTPPAQVFTAPAATASPALAGFGTPPGMGTPMPTTVPAAPPVQAAAPVFAVPAAPAPTNPVQVAPPVQVASQVPAAPVFAVPAAPPVVAVPAAEDPEAARAADAARPLNPNATANADALRSWFTNALQSGALPSLQAVLGVDTWTQAGFTTTDEIVTFIARNFDLFNDGRNWLLYRQAIARCHAAMGK